MKLSEIKRMFSKGQKVLVTRSGATPLLIVGNAGNTVMPANNVGNEERTLVAVQSKQWVFQKPDGRLIYTNFPAASEVIEARSGYVQFKYDKGTVVTIENV